jgi:Flp pilus assembly protein TadG
MMSVWTKFRSALRAFRVAQAGNVAITFAFATLPMIAFVGFAVDYSRANSVKAAMVAALDSTSLMLSKEASTDTATQLQTNAQNYFLALFTRTEAKNITVTANFTSGSTAMVVTANAEVPTTLLGIIGVDKINLTTSSTSKWGETRLRVALVLDNTGSMADAGKMAALQTATNSLLTQLKNAVTTNGDVYVSIVPFVKDVNLGAANWNSDYIYWGTTTGTAPQDPTASDNKSWDANNGTCQDNGGAIIGNYSPRNTCLTHSSCSISGYTSQSACTSVGTCSLSGYTSQSTCTGAGTCSLSGYNSQSTCIAHGACSNPLETTQSACTGTNACTKAQYTSKNPCTSNGGIWGKGTWTAATWTAKPGTWTGGIWSTTSTLWVPNNHNTWNGCTMDRGNPGAPDTINNYDTNVISPDVTKNSSLYAAEQYGSCPQAVMGLNYNWSAMISLVNNMSPAGNTNQAIGLQLGWLSLVGGGPFTVPAMNPNYKYTQAIILLTDGLNTQDRWYTSQGSIDTRQQLTCNNINAAGITLYTIQVNTGGDPTSTLLQNCAGSPGKYPDSNKFYLLTSANQMLNVFTQIGTELSQLRIAQ